MPMPIENLFRHRRDSSPRTAMMRQLCEIFRFMAEEQRHITAFLLLHAHRRRRHRACARVPRHRHPVVEAIALMPGIRCKANTAPIWQIDNQHLLPRCMTRRFHQLMVVFDLKWQSRTINSSAGCNLLLPRHVI